jgi:adenosylcobinamide kinase/adenosylcobinamide-phosphate guanylyltransferase
LKVNSVSQPTLVLVTGGVKSGKSQLAYRCAESLSPTPVMIATARRFDNEFNDRIQRHIDDRPAHWQTIEAPIDLATSLIEQKNQTVVIDCLGVWLTNLLVEVPELRLEKTNQFLDALSRRTQPTIIVSNESGFGVIGADAITRQFVDELGLLNQTIAKRATHFATNFSGFPVWLKGNAFV